MAEHGILFSAPMVRALLEGRKVQTRRLIKFRPHHWQGLPGYRTRVNLQITNVEIAVRCAHVLGDLEDGVEWLRSPYGGAGDRIVVREAWRTTKDLDHLSPTEMAKAALGAGYRKPWAPLEYLADNTRVSWPLGAPAGRGRPGIHLPHWASRLTLEVTDVRVEQLQDITQADARAEGVVDTSGAWEAVLNEPLRDTDRAGPRGAFEALWRDLHGPASWEANPWVWVVAFRRVDAAR